MRDLIRQLWGLLTGSSAADASSAAHPAAFPQDQAQPAVPTPVAPRAGATGVTFRATEGFMSAVRRDLERPHAFAWERVGFITVRAARGAERLVLLADEYFPVGDEDYIDDPRVGAMMGPEALRKGLELALLKRAGVFHVHMHGPSQRLWFSGVDLREQVRFIPDFFTVCPQMPHGALVLDARTAAGRAWLAPDRVVNIDEFESVGPRMTINRANADGSTGFYA